MKPGQIITLPKPDKRYKPGVIKKDSKGRWRGHPDSVTLTHASPMLRPPLLAPEPLMKWLEQQGLIA